MRELRFVAPAEDGGHVVVESTGDGARFVLRVDDALRMAVHSDLPKLHAESDPVAPLPIGQQSALLTDTQQAQTPAITPREIQVRVRAGETPEDLAAAHGMTLDRIMRFAGPVLDERRRIADEARRARARRAATDGGEGRQVQFGEAVDDRFRAHGIDADAVEWDARRRDDGEWLIDAQWIGGEATHTAQWLFSRAARSVTPLDDAAADLLSDRPIRPVSPPPRPTLTAAPPLVPGIVAFPPMPDAHTGPVPVVEEVFDQEAAPEGPRDVPPLVGAAATPTYDEPPLPLGIATPAPRFLGTGRREESEDERAARARVPSWDDILLGIKRRD